MNNTFEAIIAIIIFVVGLSTIIGKTHFLTLSYAHRIEEVYLKAKAISIASRISSILKLNEEVLSPSDSDYKAKLIEMELNSQGGETINATYVLISYSVNFTLSNIGGKKIILSNPPMVDVYVVEIFADDYNFVFTKLPIIVESDHYFVLTSGGVYVYGMEKSSSINLPLKNEYLYVFSLDKEYNLIALKITLEESDSEQYYVAYFYINKNLATEQKLLGVSQDQILRYLEGYINKLRTPIIIVFVSGNKIVYSVFPDLIESVELFKQKKPANLFGVVTFTKILKGT